MTIKRGKPTKYELVIINGVILLRVYGLRPNGLGSTIESLPYQNGKSLPGLRKHGASRAAYFGVPFEDKTAKVETGH